MFRRKLTSLQYGESETLAFDINNPVLFGRLVIWLEDQNIRHYKIEDRKQLRHPENPQRWQQAFLQYLESLGCPILFTPETKCQVLDWLLGYSVKLEYCDYNESNHSILRDMTAENLSRGGSKSSKGIEALKNVDVNSADFKAGLSSVCLLLDMPRHDNHMIMLQSLAKICEERLLKTDPGEKTAPETTGSRRMKLTDVKIGFQTKKEGTEKPVKVLRLLHIRELRELQSKIDEAIVACQRITADPKIDQRLGKVGR